MTAGMTPKTKPKSEADAAVDAYTKYKKSDYDTAKSTAGEVMTLGDIGGILPEDMFGGDDSDILAKLSDDARFAIAREKLEDARTVRGENNATVSGVEDSIFGRGKSSTGFVDQYGNEVNVQDVNEARKRIAEGKSGKAQRPEGIPETAVREQASNGKYYWRQPGISGKEGGWYREDGSVDIEGDGDSSNSEWYEATSPEADTAESEEDKRLAGLKYTRQSDDMVDPGLESTYADLDREERGYLDQFLDQVNGIKDPKIADYVGDFNSDKSGQLEALKRLDPLTSIQETAEERLIREMARRDMEGQMKGDREAMAQNLKQRGVYGSGAELAGQLASQQETASRRSAEELRAQANAQTRAMDALGKYSDLQSHIRDNDSVEGMFNNKTKQEYDQTKTKQEADLNRDRAARYGAAANAGQTTVANATGRVNNIVATKLGIAGLKTGTNTTGLGLTNGAATDFDATLGRGKAEVLANAPDGGLLNLGLGDKGNGIF